MARLQVGQAFGVFLLAGLGVGTSAPRFLGTQPPYATQAQNYDDLLCIYTNTISLYGYR